MTRYPIETIKAYVHQILLFYGLEERVVAPIADCMIMADACGVHTHGLSILAAHIDRVKRGGYCLSQFPEVIKQTEAFAAVDSKNTFGFVSGDYCMRLAVLKAKKSGIYTIFARNCNTYGPAFYYARLAAEQGLLGITFCNSPTAMPAWGGKEKLLGTNPFAAAIPGKHNGPVLFDMATSIVAKSKINEARKKGERIPEGWALDENGNSTTDPIEAIKGLVLPMAGPKGYGLAMVIDLVAGVLSSAAYLDGVNRFYTEDNSAMNVGQVFVAIDPTIVCSDEFYDNVDDYIDRLHQSAALDGQTVRFPGERKLQEYEKSKREGVGLTEFTVDSINKLMKECGFIERL